MPLYRGQLSVHGLSERAADLTVTSGRKVTLLIYGSGIVKVVEASGSYDAA